MMAWWGGGESAYPAAMVAGRSLVAVLTFLVLVACGGSSRPSVSSTTATSVAGGSSGTASGTASTAATAPTSTTRTATHAAATHAAAARTGTHAATTATTAASRPPEVPGSRAHKTPHAVHPSGGGQEISTALVIARGGRLTPAGQAFPSAATVHLQLSNRDHASHVVVVTFPRRQTVHLAPGGKASILQNDVPPGNYRILVDGRPEGQLVVGAQGGP